MNGKVEILLCLTTSIMYSICHMDINLMLHGAHRTCIEYENKREVMYQGNSKNSAVNLNHLS